MLSGLAMAGDPGADEWRAHPARVVAGVTSGRACAGAASTPATLVQPPAAAIGRQDAPDGATTAPERSETAFLWLGGAPPLALQAPAAGASPGAGAGAPPAQRLSLPDRRDPDCALQGVVVEVGDPVPVDAPTARRLEREIAAATALDEALRARVRGDLRTALPAFARAVDETLPASRAKVLARLHRVQFGLELQEAAAVALDLDAAAADLAALPPSRREDAADDPLRLFAEQLMARQAGQRGAVAVARQRLADLAPRVVRALGPAHEDALTVEIYLAALEARAGQTEAAAVRLAAVESAWRARAPTDPLRMVAESRLASIETERGASAQAERRLRDALEATIAAGGADSFAHARYMLELGAGLAGTRPMDALPALRRSTLWLDAELGPRNPLVGFARESLAYAQAALGRFDDALPVQRALVAAYVERFGVDDSRTVTARHNLGRLLFEVGQGDEASALFADLIRAADARGDPAVAANLRLDLALRTWERDGPAVACRRVDEARRIVGAASGVDDNTRLNVETVDAVCAARSGRPDEAVTRLRAVLVERIATYGEDGYDALSARAALARALIDAGAFDEARLELTRFAALVEAVREREPPEPGSGRTYFAQWQISDDRQAGYRDLAWLHARAGRVDDAIRVAEASRARGIGDALGLAIEGTGLPTRERLRLNAAAAAIRELDAELALLPPGSAARLPLEEQRAALDLELVAARDALRHSAAPVPVRRRALGDALPPGTVFVGVQPVHGAAWAYVVRRDRKPAVVMLGRPDVLAAAPALAAAWATADGARAPMWRRTDGRVEFALSPPTADSVRVTPEALAAEMATALLAPLAPYLAGARRVVFAADGPLALLPVEPLPWRGATLVGHVDVAYAPSLTAWASLAALPRSPHRRDLVAFGAPDYARLTGTEGLPPSLARLHWSPLPAAEAEVAAIAARFRADRRLVVTGAGATKMAFATAGRDGTLASTRYLHVAAHGHLSPGAPQWSSLVLAGDRAAPGYVTAAEIATYAIGADLVVLSACETALGKDVAGEGVFGLPYALTVAGARATLLSLWPVSDDSAAAFMARFYARLAQGAPPAVALAATKREFIRDPKFAAPFHWAPWVLYGG
jgi:CHAT domain-containing protein